VSIDKGSIAGNLSALHHKFHVVNQEFDLIWILTMLEIFFSTAFTQGVLFEMPTFEGNPSAV
jgi:hypothetical protein